MATIDLVGRLEQICGSNSDLTDEERQAVIEAAVLIERLDKTEDGQPVLDGDEIWAWVGNRLRRGVYCSLGYYEYAEGYTGQPSINTKSGECIATLGVHGVSGAYSTREAAEAAKAKEVGDGGA